LATVWPLFDHRLTAVGLPPRVPHPCGNGCGRGRLGRLGRGWADSAGAWPGRARRAEGSDSGGPRPCSCLAPQPRSASGGAPRRWAPAARAPQRYTRSRLCQTARPPPPPRRGRLLAACWLACWPAARVALQVSPKAGLKRGGGEGLAALGAPPRARLHFACGADAARIQPARPRLGPLG
jgi:hypothetical protein